MAVCKKQFNPPHSIYKIMFVILLVLNITFSTISLVFASTIGDDVNPESGTGSTNSPYIYTVDALSKVSWKHLLEIGQGQVHEVYQIIENGALQYSWYFPPEICTNPAIYGPYFLGINKYSVSAADNLPGGSSEESLYFSFALKRDFPGQVKITLRVANNFAEGTVLNLNYYGGYDSTMVHGDSPLISPEEIYDYSGVESVASGVVVSGGYAVFYVRHGGNYYLTPSNGKNANVSTSSGTSSNSETSSVTENTTNSGGNSTTLTNEKTSVPTYSDEVVIGVIGELFSDKIAETIADYFGRTIADTITQGDLNSIKKLYFADMGLHSLMELEKYYFGGLEQLTASGNNLEAVPHLQAPQITYIDLSNNKIVDVTGLLSIPTLENINLSNNQIANMVNLSGFTKLVTLDLSNNKLTSWSAGMKSDTLRYLNISGNPFEKEIDTSGLTALEDLEYNQDTGLSLDSEAYSKEDKEEIKAINAEHIVVAILSSIVVILIVGFCFRKKIREIIMKFKQ